jgi:hypothetical protein
MDTSTICPFQEPFTCGLFTQGLLSLGFGRLSIADFVPEPKTAPGIVPLEFA